MSDPFGSSSDCFSLFFNLIISQLFMSAISSVIEFIRIFIVNILSKYILKEEYIYKYGIYLHPIISAVFLLLIGLSFYYLFYLITSDGKPCQSGDLIKYLIYFVLIVVAVGIILFLIFYLYRIKKKTQQLYIKRYGYRVSEIRSSETRASDTKSPVPKSSENNY